MIFALLMTLALTEVSAQNTARIKMQSAKADLKGVGLLSWINPAQSSVTTNENGVFEISAPQYFLIGNNLVYITPGDELTVTFDAKVPAETRFEGRGAKVNNYLATRNYIRGGSLYEAGHNLRPTLEATLPLLDSAVQARRAVLEGLGLPAEFVRTEQARIDADYLNSLVFYPNNNPKVYGENYGSFTREQFEQADKRFMARIEPYARPVLERLTADESLLELPLVRSTLSQYAARSLYGVALPPRFVEAMDAANHLDTRGIKGSMTESQFAALVQWGGGLKDADIRGAFEDRLESLRAHVTPDRAIDVEVTTLSGERKKLSDFTGKPIYVDVWATWCGPCKAMAPHYERLSEEFPDVQFIAISIDKDIAVWQKFMEGKEHGNVIELWGGEEVTKAWAVSGVPRFMLIDGTFDIVSTNAPRPTTREEIVKALSSIRN